MREMKGIRRSWMGLGVRAREATFEELRHWVPAIEERLRALGKPDLLYEELLKENKDLNRHREWYHPDWGLEFEVSISVEIPEWVYDALRRETVDEVIWNAIKFEKEEFEKKVKRRYRWIKKVILVGRIGKWVVVVFDGSLFERYRNDYKEAWDLWLSAEQALRGLIAFDSEDLAALRRVVTRLERTEREIKSIIGAVRLLQEEIQRRVRALERKFRSDDFWRDLFKREEEEEEEE